MKFIRISSALIFALITLGGVSVAAAQDGGEVADLTAEIEALDARIGSLDARADRLDARADRTRNRARRNRLRTRAQQLRVRIDRLIDEVAQLEARLDALGAGGGGGGDPAPDRPLVSLRELAELAVAAGLTLDDIERPFGAMDIVEFLSRTSTVQRGFLDIFRFSLRRPEDRAVIDAQRRAVAAQLGVRI